jgi:hypothetical protein
MGHYSAWGYDQLYQKNDRYTKLQAQQWNDAGKDVSFFKLLIGPMWRFFREYILQGSILDGKVGIQTAWVAAFYSFNKQARLWELKYGLEQQDLDAIIFREMAAEVDTEQDDEPFDAFEEETIPEAEFESNESLADAPDDLEAETSVDNEVRRAA